MNEVSEKIRLLNDQAWADRNKDVQRSLKMAQEAEALLLDHPDADNRELVKSLGTQGYCLEHLSRYGEALAFALRALELAHGIGDPGMVATIDNTLGSIYWRLADYSSALDHFMHGLDLIQNDPDPELETFLLQGLGALHAEMGDYEPALKYFKRGMEAASAEDVLARAMAFNNVAYTLHVMKRDKDALPYAEKALELFGAEPFSVGRLEALHTVGSIYFQLGDISRAAHYFETGVQDSELYENRLQTITALFGVCQVHEARGELDAARQKLSHILRIAEEIESLASQCSAHELLASIYKRMGNFERALEHYELFHAIHVKIFNEKSEQRFHHTQVLLEVETVRKQVNRYRTLAATDSLTGLLSRREFFELAGKAINQARYRRLPVSLLMIDLDVFKPINDQYGHSVGDRVLAIIAGRLKSTLRQNDLAGRYGGDEFVILMPEINLSKCHKIAERCRKVVAEQAIEIDSLKLWMSISIGLAVLKPGSTLQFDDLIRSADQALLHAKKEGRNRIISSGSL